jgi:hypothetical protein
LAPFLLALPVFSPRPEKICGLPSAKIIASHFDAAKLQKRRCGSRIFSRFFSNQYGRVSLMSLGHDT